MSTATRRTGSRLAPRSWLRLPYRTARIRLTALYGALFLGSGVALVAVTYVLFERATEFRSPRLPKIPHAPAIQNLQPQLVQLAELKKYLGILAAKAPSPLANQNALQLTTGQQLMRDERQLAQSVHQLAQAVHQLTQAGTVEAAQRAADSHQLLVNSGIALAIVAVLGLLAGWLVAGRILRPIRTITRTARRISSTSLHERLALEGPQDELKELGDTLDSLFARLEAAFEAQRHFVANASHELRTPLTAERTLLQVALDDPGTTNAEWRSTATEVLASTDEQAGLIEALLTLASSESGLTEHEPTDLAAAVSATLADLRPEIGRLGIAITSATTPAPLEGDPLLVERLVANLLGNAIRHNVSGGHVQVATRVQRGRAVLSVTNTGPAIPPADVDRLFQPFQRLGRRRANYKDGHGLGLSIVRAIATAHGATIAADAQPGGGLSVRVAFPQLAAGGVRPPVDREARDGTAHQPRHGRLPRGRRQAGERPRQRRSGLAGPEADRRTEQADRLALPSSAADLSTVFAQVAGDGCPPRV
jgi:signal transduction histidine kinase